MGAGRTPHDAGPLNGVSEHTGAPVPPGVRELTRAGMCRPASGLTSGLSGELSGRQGVGVAQGARQL